MLGQVAQQAAGVSGFQWAQLFWQVIYGLITAGVAILGVLLPVMRKMHKKWEEKVAEKIKEATDKLRTELRAEMSDEEHKTSTQLQEGDKEFALLKQKLDGMVTESTCLQHQNKISQKMTELKSSVDGMDKRLGSLEKELVKNGNLQVGKKIDELTKLVKDSLEAR